MWLILIFAPLCCLSLPIDNDNPNFLGLSNLPMQPIKNPNNLGQTLNYPFLIGQPRNNQNIQGEMIENPNLPKENRESSNLFGQPINSPYILSQSITSLNSPTQQLQVIDSPNSNINNPVVSRQPRQGLDNPHFPRQPKLGESPFFVVSENVSSIEYDALISDLVGVPLGDEDLMDPGSREQMLNQVRSRQIETQDS